MRFNYLFFKNLKHKGYIKLTVKTHIKYTSTYTYTCILTNILKAFLLIFKNVFSTLIVGNVFLALNQPMEGFLKDHV